MNPRSSFSLHGAGIIGPIQMIFHKVPLPHFTLARSSNIGQSVSTCQATDPEASARHSGSQTCINVLNGSKFHSSVSGTYQLVIVVSRKQTLRHVPGQGETPSQVKGTKPEGVIQPPHILKKDDKHPAGSKKCQAECTKVLFVVVFVLVGAEASRAPSLTGRKQ